MARTTPEHRAAQRTRIVEAARELFASRGFAATTMADIVAASGLSMGGVYRYFATKAELVLAVVDGRVGPGRGTAPSEDPGAVVRRLAAFVAPGSEEQHAKLVAQIWAEAALRPELAAVVVATHRDLEGWLTRCIVDTHQQSLPDAAARAQVALAALAGLSSLVAAGVPVQIDRFVDLVASLVHDEVTEDTAPTRNRPWGRVSSVAASEDPETLCGHSTTGRDKGVASV
jgi:AcrR family transcriptional regulator